MVETTDGEANWQCTFSAGERSAVADTTTRGGAGEGFGPHELLESALATCLNMTIRMKAQEDDVPVEGVRTSVDLDRSATETAFVYDFEVDGDVSDEQLAVLAEAAASCPVRQTLSKRLSFERA
ncbi:MAG: OsmC family protein [Haloarculaceae archaeon]